jgi:hypothetical protein
MKLFTALSICLATAATAGSPQSTSTPSTSNWVGDFTLGLNHSNLYGSEASGNEEDEYGAIEFELQLGRNFGDYFIQADFFGEFTDVGSAADSYSEGLGTAIHVMRQLNDNTGVGVFFGGLMTSQDNNSTDDESERLFIGLEAKLDRTEADYYFQVGYLFGDGGNDDNGEDSFSDATFARLVAERALTENLSLTAEVGYAGGKMDSDSDYANISNLGIALNHTINDSLMASLSCDWIRYMQEDENDELNEYIIGISLTYTFGGAPKSTNLDTPRFLRWSGISGGQLE